MGWQNEISEKSSGNLSDSEKEIISIFRTLDNEGKAELLKRGSELITLGHVQKGDDAKMA